MIANGLPTFCWVASANLRAPAGVEAEADDRLAVALVKAGLGVDQIGAGDQNALFDEIFLTALAVEEFGIGRRTVGHRLLRRHRLIDHAKIELRGLAENLLQA